MLFKQTTYALYSLIPVDESFGSKDAALAKLVRHVTKTVLSNLFRRKGTPKRFLRKLETYKKRDSDSVYATFKNVDGEFWKWAHTSGYRQSEWLRQRLPRLPDAETQIRFTGRAGDENLSQGFAAYTLFKTYLDDYVAETCEQVGTTEILDFGCGWGRILRFWLKDIPQDHIYGIDCLRAAIHIARDLNLGLEIRQCLAMPPTTFLNGKFSLIYAFSVFSHLSEQAAGQWIDEFHRILKPKGVVCLTTRPRSFITQNGTNVFADQDVWLDRYDRGEFCHEPTGGGGELEPSFYGESVIPKGYVTSNWTVAGFNLLAFLQETGEIRQNVIILQKQP